MFFSFPVLFGCRFYPRVFLSAKGIWGLKKSAVLTKKARVENSKTRERSLLRAKKAQKRAKKQRNCFFFRLTHAFWGKEAWKGGSGIFPGRRKRHININIFLWITSRWPWDKRLVVPGLTGPKSLCVRLETQEIYIFPSG